MLVVTVLIPAAASLRRARRRHHALHLVLFAHMFVVWSFGIGSDIHIYFTTRRRRPVLLRRTELAALSRSSSRCSCWRCCVALQFRTGRRLCIPNDDAFRDCCRARPCIDTIMINAAMLFYALPRCDARRSSCRTVRALRSPDRSSDAAADRGPAEVGEDRIADRIPMLSVLFADLVGLHQAAHDRRPKRWCVPGRPGALLRCICASSCGAEKIKTIGDSYMAAAGFDGRAAARRAGGRRARAGHAGGDRQQPPLGGRQLACASASIAGRPPPASSATRVSPTTSGATQ